MPMEASKAEHESLMRDAGFILFQKWCGYQAPGFLLLNRRWLQRGICVLSCRLGFNLQLKAVCYNNQAFPMQIVRWSTYQDASCANLTSYRELRRQRCDWLTIHVSTSSHSHLQHRGKKIPARASQEHLGVCRTCNDCVIQRAAS